MNHIFIREIDMDAENKISFHESSVIKFYLDEQTIFLSLEQVYDGKDFRSATIVFNKANIISSDGKVHEGNLMPTPDGEILTLEIFDQSAEIIIEWKNYKEKSRFINYYDLEYDNFTIKIF